MIDKIKLLELMSARMFHDLAGPIGAVNNSIEFFEEENQNIRDKALSIVKSSSNEAVLRLKYFRQAYGPVNDSEIALSDIIILVSEFFEKSKLTLVCNNEENLMIASHIAKIILNFVVVALGAMIYGGVLEIIVNKNDLQIKFDGKDLILTEETMAILKGDLSYITLSSTNIQTYYTHMIMQNAKCKISIDKTPGHVEFVIK